MFCFIPEQSVVAVDVILLQNVVAVGDFSIPGLICIMCSCRLCRNSCNYESVPDPRVTLVVFRCDDGCGLCD